MAEVSHIEERRGLVYIDADGRRLCAVKKVFFDRMPVREGDALDAEAYLDRLSALMFDAAYEEALTLLDYSARASGELRDRLLRKGFLAPAVDAVIERLRESRLIDDGEYAERMVQGARGKPIGLYALKRKLRAKGVDEDAAERALESVDEASQTAAAKALAERLAPRYHGQDPRAARAKLSQALARRGFGWDVISAALDGFGGEDWSD